MWKFTRIKFVDEKAAYINTSCRVSIDLRNTHTEAVLQSPHMPLLPVPRCTIADILCLKQLQRFDLMAIPAEILNERSTSASWTVLDVRLVDGSTYQEKNASLPLTVFLNNTSDVQTFKQSVAKAPVLFMCLQGQIGKESNIEVKTLKDQSWWKLAVGPKSDGMAATASTLCGNYSDVASLPVFEAMSTVDYVSVPATLSACKLLDSLNLENTLGPATEHLYQMNNVYVKPPQQGDSIRANDGTRLFHQTQVWDHSKAITLAFRSKAMLELAGLAEADEQAYEDKLAAGEIAYPLLASVRVRVQKRKASEGDTIGPPTDEIGAIVMEATPMSFEHAPSAAIEPINAFLGTLPQATDRLAMVPLARLKHSPFYNMVVDPCETCEKALVLLRATQKSIGKNLMGGFRLQTDNVTDAGDTDNQNKYRTIAHCTVENVTNFTMQPSKTGSKSCVAFAILSKVCPPSDANPHTADLHIEALQIVHEDDIDKAVATVKELQRTTLTKP